VAFDLLYLNGRDLRRLPLVQRKAELKKIVAGTDIQFSESFEIDGREMFEHACKLGLEGVISKVRDGIYPTGRTNDWVKKTCAQRETLTIAGFALDGSKWDGLYVGRRKGNDLVYAGKVDHGFDKASAAELRRRLPPDAILTCGAGNFTVWAHRYYEFSHYPAQLAPRSGSMGYGVPAAVAAKALHPDRPVVCLAGDGCLMMVVGELATAVQEGAAIVVIVANNGMYGTIRMHQERHHPGRVIGTDLHNPDFAALARAYGAHGEVVERTADFAAAFERARAAGGPAVIELRIDPEALTIRQSLSEIRAAASAACG